MAEYTPTTSAIRVRQEMAYSAAQVAEFDRWLAEHDLEVAKNAYKRGYADGLETGTADWP